MRLIIDTDTAGDDVTALVLAAKAHGSPLAMVTIVGGNVPFEQQIQNALITLETVTTRPVPVYAGCQKPLLRQVQHVTEIQGADGMGGTDFPRAHSQLRSGHAVDGILKYLARHPGEVVIVAIGPLTNIALCALRNLEVLKSVKAVFAMGGTIEGHGNFTPAAEYNFWLDPDAARIVVQSGLPLTLVPWEVALRDGALPRDVDERVQRLNTVCARLVQQANRQARKHDMDQWGAPGSVHPDALTVAAALNDAVIRQTSECYVDVETCSELTRGTLVVDWHGIQSLPPNARVIQSAQGAIFHDMLLAALEG